MQRTLKDEENLNSIERLINFQVVMLLNQNRFAMFCNKDPDVASLLHLMINLKPLGVDQHLQHHHHEQPQRRGHDCCGGLDARLHLLRLWRFVRICMVRK